MSPKTCGRIAKTLVIWYLQPYNNFSLFQASDSPSTNFSMSFKDLLT